MRNILKAAGIAAMLLTSLASCQKQSGDNNTNKEQEELPAVEISLSGRAITKADSPYATDDERAIRNVQFLLYDEDGRLVGEQQRKTGENLTLYLPVGFYNVYALVNMPTFTLEEVANETMLKEKSAYLSDSYKLEARGLEMFGHSTLYHTSNGSKLDIEVKRLAAKLEVGQIKNQFLVSRVIIDKIYIINVAGDCKIDGSPITYNKVWYNKNQLEPYNQIKDYNYRDVGYSIQRYETWGSIDPYGTTFYMYANSSDQYKTRLIFDVTIDGVDYYYPFTLPPIKNNQLYRVKLLELMKIGVPVSSSDPGSRNGQYDGDIYHDVNSKAIEEAGIIECLDW